MTRPLFGNTHKIAFIGSYTPRQCGIATFTSDLAGAVGRYTAHEAVAVAMSDRPGEYDYPSEVCFEVAQDDRQSYIECAQHLNDSGVDALCVQHEYGIYGGDAGNYLFDLLDNVRMPVTATLHTILENPNAAQRESLERLAARAERLVVMSHRGAQMLHRIHGIPLDKIDHVHHGVPNPRPGAGEDWRKELGLEQNRVLLTFGLLSPDKGIENVIEAMPRILERCPEATYVVVGATHPHIRKHHGEAYRDGLIARAEKLGVADRIVFHNRFVSLGELTAFLDLADIYVTPYLKTEQITSGTLAYAVGCGRAIISTPYWYAEELLEDDRGILVPCRDPGAIADAAIRVLQDPSYKESIQRRAAALGSTMLWSAVAEKYARMFDRITTGRTLPEPAMRRNQPVIPSNPRVEPINLNHLVRLTDDTGLIQHARYSIPLYSEGYCVDDNARALLLTSLLRRQQVPVSESTLSLLESRYMAFVNFAFDRESKRFRNFLSYDRRWLEDQGSEDSHGRTVWALGAAARTKVNRGVASLAQDLFAESLATTLSFASPRAWSYTLLGIDEGLRLCPDDPRLEMVGEALATRLFDLLEQTRTLSWPWFEEVLSYCNARIPEALMLSGQWLERKDMVSAALESLEWLAQMQTGPDGVFEPIGCCNVFRKGDAKPKFDQQPVEAYSSLCAYRRAWRLTGDPTWLARATAAAAWFHGQNSIHVPLYDPATGACFDGLHSHDVNENQGAESTLSALLAQLEMAGEDVLATPRRETIVERQSQPPIPLR